MLYMFCPYMLQ